MVAQQHLPDPHLPALKAEVSDRESLLHHQLDDIDPGWRNARAVPPAFANVADRWIDYLVALQQLLARQDRHRADEHFSRAGFMVARLENSFVTMHPLSGWPPEPPGLSPEVFEVAGVMNGYLATDSRFPPLLSNTTRLSALRSWIRIENERVASTPVSSRVAELRPGATSSMVDSNAAQPTSGSGKRNKGGRKPMTTNELLEYWTRRRRPLAPEDLPASLIDRDAIVAMAGIAASGGVMLSSVTAIRDAARVALGGGASRVAGDSAAVGVERQSLGSGLVR